MRNRFRLLAALVTVVTVFASTSLSQSVPAPQPTAITEVRLSDDADAPRVTILLRNGRIAEIAGAGVAPPPGYRIVDGGGALALPAFIDAHTTAGCETPTPNATRDAPLPAIGNVRVAMREANRKGLQPAFQAIDSLELTKEQREAYREQGFAVLHTCPSGQLLAGVTCLTTLSDAALRDRVAASGLFQAAALSARGPGYPSTLMGYLAQLRQFFLDARWHQAWLERTQAGGSASRPPFDRDLEAIVPVLQRTQRLLCRAEDSREIRRWLRFAEDQDVDIAISGGREAWKVAAELAEAQVPVFLGLDWGEEVEDPDAEEEAEGETDEDSSESESGESVPETSISPAQDDPAEEPPTELVSADEAAITEEESPETDGVPEVSWEYEEPLAVQRERRRLWEERRDCALRLHEAGVVFVLGSVDDSPAELIENCRKLVEVGLPEDVALDALTARAAEVLGLGERLGRIAVGYDADIALWTDMPLRKKAHLDWLFIDGATHEFERDEEPQGAPDEGVDPSGTWIVTYDEGDGPPATLELDMNKDGELRGTLSFETPDGETSHSEVSGQVTGSEVRLKASISIGGSSAEIRIEAEYEKDKLTGDATWKYSGGEDSNSFSAKRKPTGDVGGSGS